MRARGTTSRAGFSLIEVSIVLAVVGILVTTGFAYMLSARPHSELEQAELLVSGVLEEGRTKAISEELAVSVVFDLANDSLWIAWTDPGTGAALTSPPKTLPSLVSFDESGLPYIDGEVDFTARGSLVSGGSPGSDAQIVLVASNGEVSTLTGNIATGRFPLTGGHLR